MHPTNLPLRDFYIWHRTHKQVVSPGVWMVKKQPCVLGPWAGLATVTVSMRVSSRLELRVPVPDICGGGSEESLPSTDQLPQRGGKKASREMRKERGRL